MTNNINFSNVICGEYTKMAYVSDFDKIRIAVRKLKDGRFSVVTDNITYLMKLKKIGYKLRCWELVVNNENELIEALEKVEEKLIEVKVVIE